MRHTQLTVTSGVVSSYDPETLRDVDPPIREVDRAAISTRPLARKLETMGMFVRAMVSALSQR